MLGLACIKYRVSAFSDSGNKAYVSPNLKENGSLGHIWVTG